MRALGDVLAGAPAARTGRAYRRDARFVLDLAAVSTVLDRNQRARLIYQAEQVELRTKAKGRKSGVLGQTGLAVLRALVFGFANRATGLCCPSLQSIRERTGFCKQTVVKAIRALEAVGLLRVVRRLVRRPVVRNGVAMVTAVQATNVYGFRLDAKVVIRPLLAGKAKSFPSPMALLGLLYPGLRNREYPHTEASETGREGQGSRQRSGMMEILHHLGGRQSKVRGLG
jgi:DNA-binding MarR family transcriptional regulator